MIDGQDNDKPTNTHVILDPLPVIEGKETRVCSEACLV